MAIGRATKILQFLLIAEKKYRATLCLGIATDTLDSEGEVVGRCLLPENCLERLEQLLPRFRGRIEQVPPMFSALKQNGVPLYKLAREGKTVEREARFVEISRLEIVSVDLPCVVLDVDCSKGTYVRTLVGDIGAALGCGAHLTALRRLQSGPFSVTDCVTLEALQEADIDSLLLPIEEALQDYPAVSLDPSAAATLRFGVPPGQSEVTFESTPKPGELVRLMDANQLLAMARYAPERDREKRGDFELIRVFAGA